MLYNDLSHCESGIERSLRPFRDFSMNISDFLESKTSEKPIGRIMNIDQSPMIAKNLYSSAVVFLAQNKIDMNALTANWIAEKRGTTPKRIDVHHKLRIVGRYGISLNGRRMPKTATMTPTTRAVFRKKTKLSSAISLSA